MAETNLVFLTQKEAAYTKHGVYTNILERVAGVGRRLSDEGKKRISVVKSR